MIYDIRRNMWFWQKNCVILADRYCRIALLLFTIVFHKNVPWKTRTANWLIEREGERVRARERERYETIKKKMVQVFYYSDLADSDIKIFCDEKRKNDSSRRNILCKLLFYIDLLCNRNYLEKEKREKTEDRRRHNKF